MPLKAYEEFAAEPLAFPIGGKVYTPPAIGARTGMTLVRVLAGDTSGLAEGTTSLWQLVLGPVYDEMLEDDVPLDALARAGFCVLVDWQNDRAAAIRVWESGIDPEARAALAAAARSTIRPSTRQGAASTTRRRASGTGTRKKTKAKKTGSRSAGRRLSDAGETSSPTSPPSTASDSTSSSTDSLGENSQTSPTA